MVDGVGAEGQRDGRRLGEEVPFEASTVDFPGDEVKRLPGTSLDGTTGVPGDLRDDQVLLVDEADLPQIPRPPDVSSTVVLEKNGKNKRRLSISVFL